MRICFLSPQIPSGAYGRRGWSFLSALAAQGHEITLCCIADPGPVEDAARRIESLGIPIHAVSISRLKRWGHCLTGWFGKTPLRILHCRSGALREVFLSELRDGRYDLLHVDRFRMAPYAMAAREFFCGPVVVDYPDALSLYYQRAVKNPRHFFKAFIDRRENRVIPLYEQVLLNHDFIHLVCSEVDRAVLRSLNPQAHIEVITHRVDTAEFQPRSRKDLAARGVFTGTLYYLPNIDGLLWLREKVLPLISDRKMMIDVVGFGATSELDPVKADPRFHMTGYVERMSDHLFQEDIYLCPIHIAAGVRNKLLEAFAAGMATVSTWMGYEGIDCEPGTHLLVAESPDEFADAIRFLLDHPDERRRIGNAARQLVCERYSPEAFECSIQSFYARVLNKSGEF